MNAFALALKVFLSLRKQLVVLLEIPYSRRRKRFFHASSAHQSGLAGVVL
jgi:hypothetical protein